MAAREAAAPGAGPRAPSCPTAPGTGSPRPSARSRRSPPAQGKRSRSSPARPWLRSPESRAGRACRDILCLLQPRGLEDRVARAGRNFPRPMVLDPDEVGPPGLRIVADRALLLHDGEAVAFKQPDQFA